MRDKGSGDNLVISRKIAFDCVGKLRSIAWANFAPRIDIRLTHSHYDAKGPFWSVVEGIMGGHVICGRKTLLEFWYDPNIANIAIT